jgi:hypothetical protein
MRATARSSGKKIQGYLKAKVDFYLTVQLY